MGTTRAILLGSFLTLLLPACFVFAAGEDAFYKLGPDSLVQTGVPHGKFVGPTTLPSQIYPGTQHTYFVYVPAQYDPAKPAALTIFNDGQAMMAPNGDVRAQNVLDNLGFAQRNLKSVACTTGRSAAQQNDSAAKLARWSKPRKNPMRD